MNVSETWRCPFTGEILKNGMKQKEILGVDYVCTHCPLYEDSDGYLHLIKGGEEYFVLVSTTQLWCWEFVEKVRRLFFKN